jgi:hypothetical protein
MAIFDTKRVMGTKAQKKRPDKIGAFDYSLHVDDTGGW